MSQIRNLQEKWYREIVFLLTFRNTEMRSVLANQNDKGSLQKTHWRSSTEKFGAVIAADHKVLNEEGESRNNRSFIRQINGLVRLEGRRGG